MPGALLVVRNRVIAALDIDRRLKQGNRLIGGQAGKENNRVHTAECGDHLCALGCGDDGAERSLARGRARVVIDADDEQIAESTRRLQISDMADVQEVEMPVGKDDPRMPRALRAPKCR